MGVVPVNFVNFEPESIIIIYICILHCMEIGQLCPLEHQVVWLMAVYSVVEIMLDVTVVGFEGSSHSKQDEESISDCPVSDEEIVRHDIVELIEFQSGHEGDAKDVETY